MAARSGNAAALAGARGAGCDRTTSDAEFSTAALLFVALRSNNLTCNEGCPACGVGHKDAATPLWLFGYASLGDANECRREAYVGALCRPCAEKHDRSGLRVLDAANTLWHALGGPDAMLPIMDALQEDPPAEFGAPQREAERRGPSWAC